MGPTDCGDAARRWTGAGGGGAAGRASENRVENMLRDAEGLWVLGPREEAMSEFALTSWRERRSSVRLDRVFRAGAKPLDAGSDCLWIVDYKTATHGTRGGGGVSCGGAGEVWAADGGLCAGWPIVSRLDGCAWGLYYPMLPRLVWWTPCSLNLDGCAVCIWVGIVVADVGSANPEDDVFGDVGGVVADALQIARDDERVERLRSQLGLFLDERAERVEGGVVHLVDLIVEQEDGLGEFGVGFDEGLQRFAHHRRGERGELGDVDGKIDVGEGAHLADADGDVDGLVADALEIGVDADDREDEAKVDGHGLLHGEEVERHLVDLALEAVDRRLGAEDELADAEVAGAVGLDGALDGLLGHAGHDEQLFLEVVEILMKFDAHQPNLPVM